MRVEGQGTIRDRLKEHRLNTLLDPFWQLRPIVRWAVVDAASRDGVERYLGKADRPVVLAALPDASPITDLIGD